MAANSSWRMLPPESGMKPLGKTSPVVRNEDEPFAVVQSARRSANGIYGLLLEVGGFRTGLSFRDSLL
jgi:folate-dependent tRNA-U54 methylase TrmFO/GidA